MWSMAARQEMLTIQDALMASGSNRLLADGFYAGQAELTPGDRWMLWRDRHGPFWVSELPSLAEIDLLTDRKFKER